MAKALVSETRDSVGSTPTGPTMERFGIGKPSSLEASARHKRVKGSNPFLSAISDSRIWNVHNSVNMAYSVNTVV